MKLNKFNYWGIYFKQLAIIFTEYKLIFRNRPIWVNRNYHKIFSNSIAKRLR